MARFTAGDGAGLHYTDEGSGLPVLCLAGLTRTGADFDYLAPHLPGVRLVRMDYRGRGQSDRTGAGTYTVAQEAQDATALLDHLGLTRAALIGTSRGGLIGMVLAAGGRLSGLCLNDIGPVIERAGLERIKAYVGRNPAARTYGAMAQAMPRHNPGFVGVPPDRWLAEVHRLYEENPAGLVIRYDPALRTAFLAGFDAPPTDLWPLWDSAQTIPVAVIRGANSDLLSAETVAMMRQVRPDLRVAEVPGRGHVPFLDEPESLTLIRAFLQEVA